MSSLPPFPPSPTGVSQQDLPSGVLSSSPRSTNSDNLEASQESSQHVSPGFPSGPTESERHPKGRRKRTVAKDKAILENAYNANHKPDKAQRLKIVEQVSLNEKEVQIWFQNRRQNDRRKSRPLTNAEIAAFRHGSMQIISSDPAPYDSSTLSLPSSQSMTTDGTEVRTTTPVENPEVGPWLPGRFEASHTSNSGHFQSSQREACPSGPSGSFTPAIHGQEPKRTLHLSRSFSGSSSFLANHWNTGSSFSTPVSFGHEGNESSPNLGPFAPSSCPSASSGHGLLPPLPSQRQCRLRLSMDGKAEINLGSSPTRPSSPRPDLPRLLDFGSVPAPSLPRSAFRRSQSAVAGPTLPPIANMGFSTNRPPPRLSHGRSRDARAWERACEKTKREDELTIQAQHESQGSAVAAINLVRSSSGVLQSNSSKRNTPTSKPSARSGIKKAKLSRATSSIARLQSATARHSPKLAAAELEPVDGHNSNKKMKLSTLVSASGNDSDKENWSPSEEGHPTASRRPLPSAPKTNSRRTMGRVLNGQKGPVFLSTRANTAPVSRRKKAAAGDLQIFEDEDDDIPQDRKKSYNDNDVVRFMRGEQVSPSKKPDLDCVAGLLSLSQGHWRR